MFAPGLDEEDADHFAEQLADFRGGDEIAAAAERIARPVIAMFRIGQAEGEIIGDADRPLRCDDGPDLLRERRGHAVRAAIRLAREIAQRPSSSMGTESSMPMVSQPPRR